MAKEWLITAHGTVTLPDTSTFEIQINNWHPGGDYETVAELVEPFKKKVADICYKRNGGYPMSFEGVIDSVKQRDWVEVVTDKDFSGTFDVTESIVIDFGA